METDLAYFRRRASEEYLGHANADHPTAKKKHLEMAKRYEDLARSIEKEADDSKDHRDSGIERNADTENEVIEQASLWL
jgi:hypothetical protein